MRLITRERFIIILSFIIAVYLYTLFSYFGVESYIQAGVLKDYFDSNVWHLEVVLVGILLGILFILINQLTEKQIFRKKSFGFNILLKSALYLLALVVVWAITLNSFLFFELVTQEQLDQFQSLLSTSFLLSGLIYYASFVLLLNFIL